MFCAKGRGWEKEEEEEVVMGGYIFLCVSDGNGAERARCLAAERFAPNPSQQRRAH